MKRLVRIVFVSLALASVAAPLGAEVKTRDKSQVKFEGTLGRVLNFFGGKAAKEGVESRTAVKGSRKATLNDNGGTIIDLAEEKVYELDAKKKTYTVKTFDQIRKEMRDAEEKAKQDAEKSEPGEKQQQADKPTKEYEVDYDVKETGQKKQIAGYDARNAVVTITVREKGKTLEDGGGMVMTSDMWLGPQIPQMKESTDFDLKYWKALEGPQAAELSAQQMATVLAMFPLVKKGMDRMAKDGDKLAGAALETTTTFEAVKTKEQLAASQQQSQSSGGGIGGLLAKKIAKKEEPKARSTIFTTHHEVLEL